MGLERSTSNRSRVWWCTKWARSADCAPVPKSFSDSGSSSNKVASCGPCSVPPAQGASGLVVIPGQHPGPAVTGEDRTEQDGGGGFPCPSLPLTMAMVRRAWPVLAHGLHICTFGTFVLARGHADAHAGHGAAPAFGGWFFDLFLG